jgi:hypothetical protein
LTEEAQASFAQHAAELASSVPDLQNFIIGNEPNLNRFWLPQFNADGSDAAAPAYLSLLAKTYSALKAADPTVTVFGGAISPRGIDRPGTGRDTHSPTVFIQDLGAAYRSSGLTGPVMDALAIHPYPENSTIPPTLAHPNTTPIGIADYTKLVGLLTKAFQGTGQPGATLPILYAEYGVETQIPAGKASEYTGTEPATIKPVRSRRRRRLPAGDGDVVLPRTSGPPDLPRLRRDGARPLPVGLHYPDETPSRACRPRRSRDVRGGVIAKCSGLELSPNARSRIHG